MRGDGRVTTSGLISSSVQLLEIAHCWNFQRNYQALFKPDPGIKGMSILNGMRVLAIMCVVMGHTWVRSNPAASPSSASSSWSQRD
mgnify:CR=1 FL=1